MAQLSSKVKTPATHVVQDQIVACFVQRSLKPQDIWFTVESDGDSLQMEWHF